MTTDRDYEIVTWESWIRAGRLTLPSGWLEQQVINANQVLRKKGWRDLEVVYVKERTSWLNRLVLFEIRGQRYAVAMFQSGLRRAAMVA